MLRPLVLLVLFVSLQYHPTYAQSPPTVGTEFQVSTYPVGPHYRPVVAKGPAGEFVVVWYDVYGNIDPYFGIRARRFSTDGAPIGDDFLINTYTSGRQDRPAIASLPTGHFVIAWESNGSFGDDDDSYSIQGQRLAADGSPLGNQFQINQLNFGRQRAPSMAALENGEFVVVWTSSAATNDDSGNSLLARRFAADGSRLASEFQVNTYTTGDQGDRGNFVAADPNGGFVIVWQSDGSSGTDSDLYSIQARRYTAAGTPIGTEFQVNSFTTDTQEYPVAAFRADGQWLVAWQSGGFFADGPDGDDSSVVVQRFDATDTPVGSELVVNTYTTASQRRPSITSTPDQGFLVVWASNGSSASDTDSFSVHGQRFTAQGTPTGVELQINTYTTGFQFPSSAAIASDTNGEMVVVWRSGDLTYPAPVLGQRYSLPLFADGFESGNTSRWTSAMQSAR